MAERIIAAGHWHQGDPDILVVFDAGYDITRLAWLLRDIPVEVPGRLRFEHTFRLFTQVLGWTAPRLRDPAAVDRWTWLIIACYAQLRLARTLAADLWLP